MSRWRDVFWVFSVKMNYVDELRFVNVKVEIYLVRWVTAIELGVCENLYQDENENEIKCLRFIIGAKHLLQLNFRITIESLKSVNVVFFIKSHLEKRSNNNKLTTLFAIIQR